MPSSKALKGLLTAYVLAAMVISTVESYTCRECFVNVCHINTKTTCETSQSCFSYRQEFYFPGEPFAFKEEKGCSKRQCMSLKFSATMGRNITFRYGHNCCHTDQCNQGDFQVPQQTLVRNGITCPACYSVNGRPCDSDFIMCTGTETKCIEVNGTDNVGLTIFAKGCATESSCNLTNLDVLYGVEIHVRCVAPYGASPPLLPTTSSLLTALILLQAWLWWFGPC